MAYMFNAPDIFGMAQARRNQFDSQLDHFVESGPFAQYARRKAAKEAKAREAERDERERAWDEMLMGMAQRQLQPEAQQQPEAAAQQPQLTPEEQAAQAAAMAGQQAQAQAAMQGYRPMARSL